MPFLVPWVHIGTLLGQRAVLMARASLGEQEAQLMESGAGEPHTTSTNPLYSAMSQLGFR